MEITNEGRAEWHRLWALVQLVAELGTPTRQEIFNLLQPSILVDKPAPEIYRVAIGTGLIYENEDKTISLGVPVEKLASEACFQSCMRDILLGTTESHQPNYLFNLFSAWYAVQDSRVFHELAEQKYFAQFNADIAETDDQRLFNDTKLPGWRKWATFLGLGWPMKFHGREVLVPDATERLRSILPAIFQETSHMPFAQFIDHVGRICPELDGGKLFIYCWQASRGSEVQGNRMSLMLSTGLRTLDKLQKVRLEYRSDALNIWQLYPAQGSIHQQLTHIEYLGA